MDLKYSPQGFLRLAWERVKRYELKRPVGQSQPVIIAEIENDLKRRNPHWILDEYTAGHFVDPGYIVLKSLSERYIKNFRELMLEKPELTRGSLQVIKNRLRALSQKELVRQVRQLLLAEEWQHYLDFRESSLMKRSVLMPSTAKKALVRAFPLASRNRMTRLLRDFLENEFFPRSQNEIEKFKIILEATNFAQSIFFARSVEQLTVALAFAVKDSMTGDVTHSVSARAVLLSLEHGLKNDFRPIRYHEFSGFGELPTAGQLSNEEIFSRIRKMDRAMVKPETPAGVSNPGGINLDDRLLQLNEQGERMEFNASRSSLVGPVRSVTAVVVRTVPVADPKTLLNSL